MLSPPMASPSALSPSITPYKFCGAKNGMPYPYSNVAFAKCVKNGKSDSVRNTNIRKLGLVCMKKATSTRRSPELSHSNKPTRFTCIYAFTLETRKRKVYPTHIVMAKNASDSTPQTQNITTFDYKKGVKNLIDTSPEVKNLPSEFVLPLESNPLSVNYGEIPIIDLSGLNGPCDTRISTVEAISSACEIWGFFMITNHGIKESLMEEMMRVAEDFFSLSLTEKMKYASDDVMSPVRFGTSLNTSKKHNLHWRDYFRHYGHPFQESFHLWPLNPPQYRQVAKEYLEELWKLAMKIGGAISEGLGLEKGYIEESLGEGLQILAANYYPPCPEPDKTLGLAAHSDHGALTILTQNGVNGLQIKHNDTWYAVQHVPGTFLVNIGDFLEILTNGKYKSVEHRATVNVQQTRISVAVGHCPELSSVIGPASPFINEREGIDYQPITYREYIKLQQSITTRGKNALHALRINK